VKALPSVCCCKYGVAGATHPASKDLLLQVCCPHINKTYGIRGLLLTLCLPDSMSNLGALTLTICRVYRSTAPVCKQGGLRRQARLRRPAWSSTRLHPHAAHRPAMRLPCLQRAAPVASAELLPRGPQHCWTLLQDAQPGDGCHCCTHAVPPAVMLAAPAGSSVLRCTLTTKPILMHDAPQPISSWMLRRLSAYEHLARRTQMITTTFQPSFSRPPLRGGSLTEGSSPLASPMLRH
jgi:hypothetical protein